MPDKFTNNQEVTTNLFSKGMNKDVDPRFWGPGNYLNAINVVFNSHEGDLQKIGNEPSNVKCTHIPYTLIGSIGLKGQNYAIFSTNNIDSEIGIFDSVTCSYTTLVNDKCLKFSTLHLIRGGVSKENYDCTESVYWNDGLNPARVLNINNVPFLKTFKPDPLGGCDIETITDSLDCEALRLTPLLTIPGITLDIAEGGNLPNGTYRIALAYSSKGIRLSDFLIVSGPEFIFNHRNNGGALQAVFTDLDRDFKEYEIVLISNVDQQVTARHVGFFPTQQERIFIDNLKQDDETIALSTLPLQSIYYEGGEGMYEVGDYLIQTAVRTRKEFNYQPQASKIRAKWVGYAVPENYYKKGGNKIGYTKGENTLFYIRFVYSTGHRSSAFPLVGREATGNDRTTVNNQDSLAYGEGQRVERWEIYNTATITRTYPASTAEEYPVMEGDFGFSENENIYPDNQEVWGNNSCKKIRGFRWPDNCMVPNYDERTKKLIILGFRVENISYPLDEDGNPVEGIVGYEIFRADKEGNKEITAKGVIYNAGVYDAPVSFNEKKQTLYANYPLNDLRTDPYLSKKQVKGGCDGKDYQPVGTFKKDFFTFHSPETSFSNPTLGNILKVEAEYYGKVKGAFEPVYQHPKNKLIRDFAFFASAMIGIGEGILAITGKTTYQTLPTTIEIAAAPNGVGTNTFKPIPLISSIIGSGPLSGLLGLKGKGSHVRTTETTSVDKIPTPLKIANSVVLFTYYFAQGTEKTLDIIKRLVPYQQYAYQYNGEAFYNKQDCVNEGSKVRRIDDYTYLYPSAQEFQGYRVNNTERESSILLKLNTEIPNPKNQDTSRQTIGTQKLWSTPTQAFLTDTSAYYVTVKRGLKTQYGEIDSPRLIPTSSEIFTLDTEGSAATGFLFGGDTVIDEFSLKRKMPFFTQDASGKKDVPNGFEFDYRLYPNLIYPRYWTDTHDYDISEFFRLTDIHLPNDSHYLDRERNDCKKKASFVVKRGYFYLYSSAIVRFFVESSYNLPYRQNSTTDEEKKHFDKDFFTDLHVLFRSDLIRKDNYYQIDRSLMPIKQLNLTYAEVQPRDFSIINARCFASEPNKLIYSLPANLESKRDTWRNFLVNNNFVFSKADGKISAIKSVNKSGALYLFENAAAKVHAGIDELQTDGGIKIQIGDGGLFAREPQAISNTDYELTECQSGFSVVSTHYGVFFISQRQGKIFKYDGGLQDVSFGIKWWLAKYLPSKLLKQFPDFELPDNPISGVGCLSVFDNTSETVYFSKKDYELKEAFASNTTYEGGVSFKSGSKTFDLGDPRFFEDASWTVSYDPKTKAWVSFHDWHPDWVLQDLTHFFTFKDQQIWRHNSTIETYCNFYGVDYPWEIEAPYSNIGSVTTLESVEYQLECFKYIGIDKHHALNENFDRAIVYNSEQCSGLLKLFTREYNRPSLILNYPKFTPTGVEIEIAKQEQKSRFNQFWDLTKNRGQFTLNWRTIFETEANGYRKRLNTTNIDYAKSEAQKKKIRHNTSSVILRRNVSGEIKMNLLMVNPKQIHAFR